MKAMQVNNAKAVGEAAPELDMAVVVGASESEGLHIYLNADHTHTLEKAEQVLCDVRFNHRCERGSANRWNSFNRRG